MQSREASADLHSEKDPYYLWRCETDAFGRKKYVEVLTVDAFFRAPPPCRGRLLADEMGLGKTCTMLALIASVIKNEFDFDHCAFAITTSLGVAGDATFSTRCSQSLHISRAPEKSD